MTVRVQAGSSAGTAVVWSLLARPAQWHRWAPHIRGAWGLGHPEVEAGRRGLVRLLGVVPVPARVVAVQPGTSWTWTVGPMRLKHEVAARVGGSTVIMTLDAPRLVELAYGPVVGLLNRRLARVAGDDR
jgi:hypothetical protein